MHSIRTIKAILGEYGVAWAVNRVLYSTKITLLNVAPSTGRWFEKRTGYPKRLNIFQIDVDELRAFLYDKLSDAIKSKLISTADKACEGIILGFSSIDLNYRTPIDWQLSPLTGRRCDDKMKWYKIPDFDKDFGDIKVVWEASRLSHFVTLSRAYLLTGDEKYYRAFSDQLKDWLEKNPYSYGANYKCGQECSIRMVNALLAFTIFERMGIVTDADASRVKDLIDRCYRKVLSNFFYAYKCIKNNHTISELMGMIVGAWCCEDQKQLGKAYTLLNEVVDEQFTVDGGYRQFSFNYQRLALQDLEVIMSISEKIGLKLNKRSMDKIKNAAILMYQCQDESGDVPNYGNNDGALAFPVTCCSYREFQPVINTVHALSAGKQLYEEGIHQEELIWFSGGKRLQDYKIEKKDKVSSQFADAGLFTIRNKNMWAMMISNNYTSRPAHMDQLHFDLWVDGSNVLCDAGTFSYADENGRKLVKNEFHNTVVAEGRLQMNYKGPFMVYDWTRRILGRCDKTHFSSRMISANGYDHIREVKLIGRSFEITDTVNTDYKVLFNTPCEIKIIDRKAVLLENGDVVCEIRSNGRMTLKDSTRSLFYLKKDKINCLSVAGKAGKSINTIIETTKGVN